MPTATPDEALETIAALRQRIAQAGVELGLTDFQIALTCGGFFGEAVRAHQGQFTAAGRAAIMDLVTSIYTLCAEATQAAPPKDGH